MSIVMISQRMSETARDAANDALEMWNNNDVCKLACRNFIADVNPYKRKDDRAVWYAIAVRMFEALSVVSFRVTPS
jgi:hypothetical protein